MKSKTAAALMVVAFFATLVAPIAQPAVAQDLLATRAAEVQLDLEQSGCQVENEWSIDWTASPRPSRQFNLSASWNLIVTHNGQNEHTWLVVSSDFSEMTSFLSSRVVDQMTVLELTPVCNDVAAMDWGFMLSVLNGYDRNSTFWIPFYNVEGQEVTAIRPTDLIPEPPGAEPWCIPKGTPRIIQADGSILPVPNEIWEACGNLGGTACAYGSYAARPNVEVEVTILERCDMRAVQARAFERMLRGEQIEWDAGKIVRPVDFHELLPQRMFLPMALRAHLLR